MANVKISNLPAASTLDGTEKVPIVQGSSTKRATLSDILGFSVPLPTSTAPAILGIPGPLIPSPGVSSSAIKESIRLPYTSAITSTNKAGDVVNLIGVTKQPDGTMPYPKGWVAIGDSNLDYVHFLSKIDCAGQAIIDTPVIGNTEGLYNTRLSQGLDSTVPGFDGLTVGISTMTATGVGYLAAIDRLIFNSGQTVSNSKATFKNLGAVELLSDTMRLKMGSAGDSSIGYFGAGVSLVGAGGFYCDLYQDTGGGGTYFEMVAGKVIVTARGATPGFRLECELEHRGTKAGFYSSAPIVKPTGVAVTAAGIHAALVSLGLIAA